MQNKILYFVLENNNVLCHTVIGIPNNEIHLAAVKIPMAFG